MDQFLMPVAASIIGREGGLPVDERLALTAAALVISGPLALAPALVAVERRRNRLRPFPDDAGGAEIGPPLVTVPGLTGATADEAQVRLKALGLEAAITLNESADDQKGRVIAQPAPPAPGDEVEAGTRIALKVGAGQPEAPDPGDDDAAITDLRRDMDQRLGDIAAQIAALTEMVKAATAQGASQTGAAPPAGSGDKTAPEPSAKGGARG